MKRKREKGKILLILMMMAMMVMMPEQTRKTNRMLSEEKMEAACAEQGKVNIKVHDLAFTLSLSI